MRAVVVSVVCESEPEVPRVEVTKFYNGDNTLSPCDCYQELLIDHSDMDVLIYVHDDLTIHDPDWADKLLPLFDNPNCVAAGFGGATALGNQDLYRKSYNIWNLARRGYASNQTDAETHGERFTGDRRVAVLDAFCMAVRTDWLRIVGGWPTQHLTHHCLDLWLACEAAKWGKEIWVTGVSCTHHGGRTSTKPTYRDATWLQGGSLESDHAIPHKWLYETYCDVLPIEVTDAAGSK